MNGGGEVAAGGLRRWTAAAAAGLLGLALLAGLILTSDVSAGRVAAALTRPGPGAAALILLTTSAHLGLGALKWKLVLARMAYGGPERPIRGFYLYYSGMVAVLAQFLTVQVAGVLVRELATRWHHGLARHGGASSLFEQLFDVYVLALFVLATAPLISGVDGQIWIGAEAGLLLAGGLPVFVAGRVLSRRPGWGAWAKRRGFLRAAALVTETRLLSPGFLLALYGLSVLRYLAMLARALLIAESAGFSLQRLDVARAFTVVQASQLIAITPGNLGIAEWTWSGVLVGLGHELGDAGEFALVYRILVYASYVVVFLVSGLVFAHSRREST